MQAKPNTKRMTQATTATIFDLLPFSPTTEQAQFLYEVEEFVNSDEDFFILRGSAGTGKTSVARAVVDYLGSLQIPCKLLAPTTRAARIIGRKTEREARTIHSRIYHIEPMDDGRVKTSLKSADDELPTLYIVDEASMVSDRFGDDDLFVAADGLLTNLVRYIKSGHRRSKVLFIGDVYQLPPVGYGAGELPPALSDRMLRERFGLRGRVVELTDVKRQAEGSAILRSATSLRDAMRLGTSWHIESGRFWGLQGAVNRYLQHFDPRRSDAVTYIGQFHKDITRFNQAVRQQAGHTDTLSIGDTVLFDKAFAGKEFAVSSGDFGKVVALVSGPERFAGLHFQEVQVEVADERGQPQRVSGKVCLEFLQAERPGLPDEARKTLYSEVMRTDAAFREHKRPRDNQYLGSMWLRYGYGITCYKAQGSEFDTVLLNTWHPHGPNLNYLYTGVTRAREQLICSAA